MFQSTRPRGARPVTHTTPSVMTEFQSTRPRGARLLMPQSARQDFLFQSTRPRGARRQPSLTVPWHSCFNPRARVGRDW